MPALTGTGILVTRPQAQSQSLCRLLEAHGARTWRLPVIDIRGLTASPAQGPFDLVVFTSANAVRHADLRPDMLAGAVLAAIGPATARALQAAGHGVAMQAATGMDSESLLATPRFADLAGRRVLLVKGRGGRELLETELAARGARVQTCEVYERITVAPDPATLNALALHAGAGELHVVTVTSAEIGAQLLLTLTPSLHQALEQVLWIVPSARVAAALQAQGLTADVRVAGAADDQGLLSAILAARGASTA